MCVDLTTALATHDQVKRTVLCQGELCRMLLVFLHVFTIYITQNFLGQELALIQNPEALKVARGAASLNSSPFFINLT
jgi:hypothetical protein